MCTKSNWNLTRVKNTSGENRIGIDRVECSRSYSQWRSTRFSRLFFFFFGLSIEIIRRAFLAPGMEFEFDNLCLRRLLLFFISNFVFRCGRDRNWKKPDEKSGSALKKWKVRWAFETQLIMLRTLQHYIATTVEWWTKIKFKNGFIFVSSSFWTQYHLIYPKSTW